MAFLLLRVAKFLGSNSSLFDGGPMGCRTGRQTILGTAMSESCGAATVMVGTGRPRPSPSYNFFTASSRGDKGGMSLEEAESGVLGEELDLDETDEESSPSAPSELSTATVAGMG